VGVEGGNSLVKIRQGGLFGSSILVACIYMKKQILLKAFGLIR
jgi:hypothetical protein